MSGSGVYPVHRCGLGLRSVLLLSGSQYMAGESHTHTHTHVTLHLLCVSSVLPALSHVDQTQILSPENAGRVS